MPFNSKHENSVQYFFIIYINCLIILQRQIIENPTPTLTLPLKGRGFYEGFLTFMEVFPIPPLSRGRSGGGWGIYVAVRINISKKFQFFRKEVHKFLHEKQSFNYTWKGG